MKDLLKKIDRALEKKIDLPFSIYHSVSKQVLLNVPVAKPLLIVVLNGYKELGNSASIKCNTGEFIFLSDSPAVDMRNIPYENSYTALLIEFDQRDFEGMQRQAASVNEYYVGKVFHELNACLEQFVDSCVWASSALWSLRKREILTLLCEFGHDDIRSLLSTTRLKSHIHSSFMAKGFRYLTIQDICLELNVSESTLRRKLDIEGTSFQAIKDRARLSLALHLLQTTDRPIGLIADECGYHSPSRFTDWFKNRFGLTPTELRKTQMTE